MPADVQAVVIGAGPAGLMAADLLSAAGMPVLVADQMPSPARKFLMAGKSGLNLTKEEPKAAFRAAYGAMPPALAGALDGFGPAQVRDWAEGLGQPLFTGSTGRVFPKVMKASPLLRAWLARLDRQGVQLRRRWRWTGWEDAALRFETPEGIVSLTPRITVLALGGASWRRLGSDGLWGAHFAGDVAPFVPANAGLAVDWSAHMERHFGAPLKGVAFHAGGRVSRGEAVLSARGLEGGGIYPLTPVLRVGAALTIDLMPDLATAPLRTRLARAGRKATLSNRLRKAGLSPVKIALVQECARGVPDLAEAVKALSVPHRGVMPMDEAISTAGGLRFDALDGLMLRARPGCFAAGEMLDWEAPTGGYLLTACLALGRAAGQQALDWARQA